MPHYIERQCVLEIHPGTAPQEPLHRDVRLTACPVEFPKGDPIPQGLSGGPTQSSTH
jgi:hypothetical protein